MQETRRTERIGDVVRESWTATTKTKVPVLAFWAVERKVDATVDNLERVEGGLVFRNCVALRL